MWPTAKMGPPTREEMPISVYNELHVDRTLIHVTHMHTFQGVWRKRTCTHTASKHLRSSQHICGLSPGNKILIVSVFYWVVQVRTGTFFPIHKKRMKFSSVTFSFYIEGTEHMLWENKKCLYHTYSMWSVYIF